MKATIRGLAACLAVTLPTLASAQVTTDAGTIDPADVERFFNQPGYSPYAGFNQPGYSPYAGRNYPTRPLWGEQHLHTSWSADAIAGGTRVGPDEALRAMPRAGRSPRVQGSRSGCRGPTTGWWSPIIPTRSAS